MISRERWAFYDLAPAVRIHSRVIPRAHYRPQIFENLMREVFESLHGEDFTRVYMVKMAQDETEPETESIIDDKDIPADRPFTFENFFALASRSDAVRVERLPKKEREKKCTIAELNKWNMGRFIVFINNTTEAGL